MVGVECHGRIDQFGIGRSRRICRWGQFGWLKACGHPNQLGAWHQQRNLYKVYKLYESYNMSHNSQMSHTVVTIRDDGVEKVAEKCVGLFITGNGSDSLDHWVTLVVNTSLLSV